jgi:hypothetical protein
VAQRTDERLTEAPRWVLRSGPTSGLQQLLGRRLERPKIRFVSAPSKIGHGVQLEMNLIDPADKVNGEAPPITTHLKAIGEPLWKPPLQKIGWAWIQPVLLKIEVSGNPAARSKKGFRERLSLGRRTSLPQGKDIHISSGPVDEPQRKESGAPTHHQLKVCLLRLQLFGQRRQYLAQVLSEMSAILFQDDTRPKLGCLTSLALDPRYGS